VVSDLKASKSRVKRVAGFAGVALSVVLGLVLSFGVGATGNSFFSGDPVQQTAVDSEWSPANRVAPAIPVIPLRLATCSVADGLADPALQEFSGVVLDPSSGEVLFSRNATTPVTPASVLKILTGMAALTTLGPDHRFSTYVKTTDDPNTVVLVGGGDATLSRLPVGSASVYAGAPTLQELAELTIQALREQTEEGEDVSITSVVVDASLWDVSDALDSTWSSDARNNGFISSVTALQVDGDRQDPTLALSRRGTDPVQRAGDAFVQALRQAGNKGRFVSVTTGTASPTATVLASVSSQPVSELVAYTLKESDNTLAEMLARHVSLATGLPGTAHSLNQALVGALPGVGFEPGEVFVQDGSGLSAKNSVTPQMIVTLLGEVARSPGSFGVLRAGLPIAGVDGSLATRFGGENRIVHGRVFAKTGSISGVRSLAGFITSVDNTELVFAFFSEGEVGDDARAAVENLVTAVYSCGSNLADF
jgi:serine-type D-Ala-D-Ala carboxypeptidase/endopeptidase (penicillin-binding protein 4)